MSIDNGMVTATSKAPRQLQRNTIRTIITKAIPPTGMRYGGWRGVFYQDPVRSRRDVDAYTFGQTSVIQFVNRFVYAFQYLRVCPFNSNTIPSRLSNNCSRSVLKPNTPFLVQLYRISSSPMSFRKNGYTIFGFYNNLPGLVKFWPTQFPG